MTRSNRGFCTKLFFSAILMCFGIAVCSQVSDGVLAGEKIEKEPGSLIAIARNIDRLIQLDLKRNKQSTNAMASDSTFLRRVYLDTVGRIPDIAETRAFLHSKNPNKRVELIDKLVESPGYISQSFNFWADTLRIKTRLNQQVSGEPFMHWMRDSLAANKPYDLMVREMLTASGAANERGNGATGYLLRDRGMPLDSMSNTVRVFLGTRIECAQCHNHPFADWTQRQFFEMAAFFGGIQYVNELFTKPEGRKLMRQARSMSGQENQQAAQRLRRQLRRTLQPGLTNTGTGVERLPSDYAYEDAKPNDFVLAKTMYGAPADLEPEVPTIPKKVAARMAKQKKKRRQVPAKFIPEIGSREAFASWVTDRENPYFTKVIVNRMWAKYMGMPLVPKIDDMGQDANSANPELSAYLEGVMRDLDYDLKTFQKIVLLTKTYQRESNNTGPGEGQRYHFSGPLARRMSAEQIWDSMLTLVVPKIDSTINTSMSARAKAVYDNYDSLVGKSSQEILSQLKGEDGQMMTPQQLRRKRQREMQSQVRPLRRRLMIARRKGDKQAEAKVLAELEELGLDPSAMNSRRKFGNKLLRASELPSPTPPGHFLREFGQSDRDQPDGAFISPTVPQVLNLVNGFIEENLLGKKNGILLTLLGRTKKTDQKIRTVFLFVLNRQPSKSELVTWRKDVAQDSKSALNDLIWTLVNCHEFRQLN
ncbi:MAG: hypothetical protein ACI97A_000551 [Planctomycetota bacterium]|jgi:hypothetical protein